MHFSKENLNAGLLSIPFVQSKNQLVEVFTKGLSNKVFHFVVCTMDMKDTILSGSAGSGNLGELGA